MDRQTLRDWVHRYNEAGIEGLADRPRSGRPACLSKAERVQVEGWVEQGADLATDGVVRFRRCDLRDRIAGRFGVYLHERSVGKLLRELNFRRLSVRPLHPNTDPAAQETFKKTSPTWCTRHSPLMPRASQWKSGFKTRQESVSKAR